MRQSPVDSSSSTRYVPQARTCDQAETCKTYSSPSLLTFRSIAAHADSLKGNNLQASRRLRSPLFPPDPLEPAQAAYLPSLRRNTRSSTNTTQAQVGRSPKTATVHPNSLEPVQQPLTASQNLTEPLQSARRKRERELEVEDEPLDMQQRTESGSVVEWVQQLNEANLENYNSQTGSETFDGMGDRKRNLSTWSRVAEMSQEAASVSSQKATSFANQLSLENS